MIVVRLPSGRQARINTDDPAVARATAMKFVQSDPYESGRRQGSQHPVASAVETFARAIPGASEAQAAIQGAGSLGLDFLTGKQHLDPKDPSGSLDAAQQKAWARTRANQQGQVDSFHAEHPSLSPLTTGVGWTAPIAAAIFTGGASAIPEVAPVVEKGIAGLLKPIAVRAARRATVGAGTGFAAGASQPGTLSERLASGNADAATGAVIGVAAPPVASKVGKTVADLASGTGKTLARAANKMSGGAMLDPVRVATQRLVESLKADGASPQLIRTALNGYLTNGATDPALIDVASRLPSGGQNTLALVRAAAGKGSGRGVAVKYGDEVAANLQDKAIARTMDLTPDNRPAPVVKAAATKLRDDTATKEYRGPYGQPVDATDVIPAIEGDAGRVGISAAYKDADALRLEDQMGELAKLRSAANPEVAPTPVARVGGDEVSSPALTAKIRAHLGLDQTQDGPVPVSLGTLDRVKISLNDAGRAAADRGENSRAAGFFQRAGEIDDHLAAHSDEYATARDNYARSSAQIDALDHGASGLNAFPDHYAERMNDLRSRGGDDAHTMAGVGLRQTLTDEIGRPTEGATGALNRISTATNPGRNLAETFGPDEATAYRGGIKDLVDQINNARFVNPNTNSASAGRLMDAGLVDAPEIKTPKIGAVEAVLGAINKIRAGATLTDGEREAIARIGTNTASPDQFDLSSNVKLLPSKAMEDMRAFIAARGPSAVDQKRANSQ